MEQLRQDVSKIVNRTSVASMAIAAVLSPVPLADEIVFLPVFGFMAARIGKAYGLATREVPWRPIAATTIAALTARAAVNVAVAYIPGVAAVANAISAASITQLLGRHFDAACADPASARALSVREITDHIKETIAARAPRTA